MMLQPLAVVLAGPAFAEEHIIDDQDGTPGFVTTGDDWATWGTNGEGFDSSDSSYHYLSHTVGGDDRQGTATWQAELRQAGTWQIDTWFRRTENRTRDANHVIIDGLGIETWLVIDQEGEGASGWVSLGEYWCDEGFGGCVVTLDGTDDNDSDAANAMRFTLVSTETSPTETDPCDETPSAGTHQVEFFAGSASSAGWQSTSNATGRPDGHEAHSENVDDGEGLWATDFDACDPSGEESIDRVVLSVNARTQYDSGPYELQLLLDAGGADHVFNGTTADWHEVDITADQDWTWSELAALRAQVTLYDHPGGQRDSDAWVDSFRLLVSYTTFDTADEPNDSGVPCDSGVPGDSGVSEPGGETEISASMATEPQENSEANAYTSYPHSTCTTAGTTTIRPAWLGLLLLCARRRRYS